MIGHCYDLIQIGEIRFTPALKLTENKNHENMTFQIFISIMVQNMRVDSTARKSISWPPKEMT